MGTLSKLRCTVLRENVSMSVREAARLLYVIAQSAISNEKKIIAPCKLAIRDQSCSSFSAAPVSWSTIDCQNFVSKSINVFAGVVICFFN